MKFNNDDLRYKIGVRLIGEITKLFYNHPQDKAEIDRSTEFAEEIGKIIAEVRDSKGTPEQKMTVLAIKLADGLRKYGMPENQIDGTVQQIINRLK